VTFLQAVADEKSAEGWQQTFDEIFPTGGLVMRDTGDLDNDPVYRCPKIRVLHVKGAMSCIYLAPADVGGTKAFLLQLVGWKQLRSEPDVFAARDIEGRPWLFSNALSDSLASELSALRSGFYEMRCVLLGLSSRADRA
jgi:hypothetical protein